MKYLNLTEEILRDYYLNIKLSVNKISKKLNIPSVTIYRYLKKYNIKKKKIPEIYYCIEDNCNEFVSENNRRCSSHAKIGKKNPNYGKGLFGINNPNWIDGRSFKGYDKEFNSKLKQEILNRDNHTCQLCFINEIEHKRNNNEKLSIHHIDYNKKNSAKNNLISLCRQCNVRVNSDRNYWIEYFSSGKYRIKKFKRLMFDIDGVICTNTNGKYSKAKPILKNIMDINKLYDQGYLIFLYTSRGKTTNKNWTSLTTRQLRKWKIKYHRLLFGKPHYDLLICDKAVNSKVFFSERNFLNEP